MAVENELWFHARIFAKFLLCAKIKYLTYKKFRAIADNRNSSRRGLPMDDIDECTDNNESHYLNSTLRERIVEHVFVGDALRRLWQRGVLDVEVLRSEFDAGGYDLVMSRRNIVRHIQFKTTHIDGKAARTNISLKLADKPSGCVIWIIVTPDLSLSSFLWFGGAPDEPLPDINSFKITRHTKGNSTGLKTERPNHRTVPRGQFEILASLDVVLERLFGPIF